MQQRAPRGRAEARVVDRTQLILDIFAQHARQRRGQAPGRARAARVQPAAHARHVAAPRAPRRRASGRAARARSQLETDRRLARRRISLLRRRLKALEQQRATRRKSRRAPETPTVALAGYTNVGKSTLLNALTGARTSPSTTGSSRRSTRRRAAFEYDGRRYLLTDTVGFIRRLPHQLVEGFAATLEETLVADLVAPRRRRLGARGPARRDARAP